MNVMPTMMRPLNTEQVDIWLCHDASIAQPSIDIWRENLLTDAERARGARFHFERDRKQFVITRTMVRSILSYYLPIAPKAWEFTANQWGRPGIAQSAGQAVCFNVSHTAGLVVMAVSGLPVLGVDVENASERKAPLDVARSYFSASEADDLYALPLAQQPERFFHYWTLKESYIKAKGKGLSIPLEQFSFQLQEPGQVSIEFANNLEPEPENWRFFLLNYAGYTLSLCVQHPQPVQLNFLRFPLLPNQTAEVASAANSIETTLLRKTRLTVAENEAET